MNEAFNKIDRDIEGVDWEVEPPEQEIQEPTVHILHILKISMQHWQTTSTIMKMRTIKITTPKVQECRTMAKAQECDKTTKAQEWIAIMRARG